MQILNPRHSAAGVALLIGALVCGCGAEAPL